MGLVDVLSQKLKAAKYGLKRVFTKTPKEFVFKEFKENFEKNDKLVSKKWQLILCDINIMRNRREVFNYLPEVEYDLGELTLDVMEITNSEMFSTNFADFVTAVKLYAANYISTDEGKTDRERKYACLRLDDIMNCLNFNLLTHVNIETNYWIEPDGDEITIQKKKMSEKSIQAFEKAYNIKINQEEGYVFKLVMMQNKINEEINKISHGIWNKDRDPVFAGFRNLCDKDFYKLPEEYKEEYGLQD